MNKQTSLLKFIFILIVGSPIIMILAFVMAGLSVGLAIPAGLFMYMKSTQDKE